METEDCGLKGSSQGQMRNMAESDMLFSVPVKMSALQTAIRQSSG